MRNLRTEIRLNMITDTIRSRQVVILLNKTIKKAKEIWKIDQIVQKQGSF